MDFKGFRSAFVRITTWSKEKFDEAKETFSSGDKNKITAFFIKELHLDDSVVKALLEGLSVVPGIGMLGPIVVGFVEDFKEKNQEITLEDTKKILNEVNKILKEINNLNMRELKEIEEISEGKDYITDWLKSISTKLESMDAKLTEIGEEVKLNGFENIKKMINDGRNEDDINRMKQEFYSGKDISGYIPFVHNFDVIRDDTKDIETKLENDEIKGILILGESLSGKTTILKRVSYDYMQKGWEVYVNLTEFKTQKLINSIKNTKQKTLLVIDNAIDFGLELKNLIKAVWELNLDNVKFLMAERREKFKDKNQTLGEKELKRYRVEVYELNLTINDEIKFIETMLGDRELADSLREAYKPNETDFFLRCLHNPGDDLLMRALSTMFFLDSINGIPGTFVSLLDFINSVLSSSEDVDKAKKHEESAVILKAEEIEETTNEEDSIFRKIAIIGKYGGTYPVNTLKKVLKANSVNDIYPLLESLEKKGHIKLINENIVSYPSTVIDAFLKRKIIDEYDILNEFVENYDSKNAGNLVTIAEHFFYLSGLQDVEGALYEKLKKEEMEEFNLTEKIVKKAIEIIKKNNANSNYDVEHTEDRAHFLLREIYDKTGRFFKRKREDEWKSVSLDQGMEEEFKTEDANYSIEDLKEIEKYKRAVELNENNVAAHINLGDVYMKIKNYENAEEEYRKATEISDSAEAHYRLGKLYKTNSEELFTSSFRGTYIIEFRKAVQLKENDFPDAHIDIGVWLAFSPYSDPRNFSEAEKEFKKAIEISKDMSLICTAHTYLKDLYKKEKRFEDAIDIAEKLITLKQNIGKDSYTDFKDLGLLYEAVGKDDKAEEMLKRAIDMDEKEDVYYPGAFLSDLYACLAELYKKNRRYDEAKKIEDMMKRK